MPSRGLPRRALALVALASLLLIGGLSLALLNWFWVGLSLVAGAAVTLGVALYMGVIELDHQRNRSRAAEMRSESLEFELASHQDALDDLADGLQMAVFLVNEASTVIYANRKATEVFRIEEPAGQSITAVTLAPQIKEMIDLCRLSASPTSAEIQFGPPTDTVGLCQVWQERSELGRIFVSIYDVSDLRRLERVRRDFVANVSHELRTPMTTVRAMAETILEEEVSLSETSVRYLNKTVNEVERLTRITADLLTLSHAESETLVLEPVRLAETVRVVVEQLQHKARKKGLQLTFQQYGDPLVVANRSSVSQIWMNLIDNAINYTAHGSVDVTLKEEGNSVTVDVHDTGIGIGSEHIPRLFERFYRVDKARSRETGGTGLGLSIVRHLTESHGGHVTVQSELNKGSQFRVTLPKAAPCSDTP